MVIAALFLAFFFGVCLVLLVLLALARPAVAPAGGPTPRVSILVAARNEEANIERCLHSLAALDYPVEQLEILIGDDGSTDATARLVRAFIADRPQFRLLSVHRRVGKAQGKSNALVHLCRAATAEFLLFTDADMALPPSWVRAMVAAAAPPDVGVVTGAIGTSGGGLFGQLQGLDWLFGLSVVRLLSDRGVPVTAVGNNMLVRRAAYESVGGYEALAFTITEDLVMFQQLVARGWRFRNLLGPAVLGRSRPQPTWRDLLQQRKRWMRGAGRLPAKFSCLFGLYGAFYAVAFSPGLVAPAMGLAAWAVKVLLQTMFLALTLRQAGRRMPLGALLLYEFYLCLMSGAVLAYTLWPGQVVWKARPYRWAEG